MKRGDPGGVDEHAKIGQIGVRLGLGWAKSHVFVTGQCPAEAEALAIGCLAKPYPQRTLLAAIGAVEAQVADLARK